MYNDSLERHKARGDDQKLTEIYAKMDEIDEMEERIRKETFDILME